MRCDAQTCEAEPPSTASDQLQLEGQYQVSIDPNEREQILLSPSPQTPPHPLAITTTTQKQTLLPRCSVLSLLLQQHQPGLSVAQLNNPVPKVPVPGPSSPGHEQMLLQLTSQSGAALLPKSGVESRSTVGFVDYPGSRLAKRLCLAVFASGLCSVALRTVQAAFAQALLLPVSYRGVMMASATHPMKVALASLKAGRHLNQSPGIAEDSNRPDGALLFQRLRFLRDNIHNPRETARADTIKPFAFNRPP
ncbi:hypothetical protein CSAL01_02887 [Colletotrichum salicis]|uniref:Uncharacterized protein n=1 Tax=Colletotrichum salicis TaxID=1209931 RepID=A0A135S169_9PEZI|nr:hypothetical protein CSAL01_02887 [Colletotrichum salicis]